MKESAENYLETIFILKKQLDNVRSIDVVTYTGFSKPSISEAMKKLKAQKLITIDSNGYIDFTPEGYSQALSIYEKHQVITTALEYLGVPSDIAEQDACKIEHSLSDVSFNMIKKYILKIKSK